MKVVFFVYRYWPVVGGVEKYIHELAKALLAMGHRVEVVAGATAEGLPERDEHEGVQIHRFPALRSPLRSRWWLMRHLHLFARADVIHISNTHMLEYFWQMLGPLVNRRKVFLTRHGMSYRFPVPEADRSRAVRTLGMAAGIVHDGEFIETWLGTKPDLCPDQGLAPPAEDLPYVPEPPPTSATFVGRLETDSGIGIYLDAVRILTKKMGHPFQLNVYGDGSMAPAMRERVARERLPVRFHGATPEAQRHIVDACFAFIDGRMAIQEAMARRRLVLTAYVNPLKRDYVCGEPFSPYLVAAGTGDELAKQTDYLINHPQERAVMVQRAFAHVCRLRWSRTADAYMSFWKAHLQNPRTRTSWLRTITLAYTLQREASRMRTPVTPAIATP